MFNAKNLLFSQTAKDTYIVFIGTIINVLAGGLFFIYVPRFLGPSDYGLFSTVMATGIFAANLANFGIDTGILKFAKIQNPDFNKYLTLAFKSYAILGTATAIIGIFASGFLAIYLNQPQIANLLRLAFVSTVFLLLTNFYTASLQAQRKFAIASLIGILGNITRLVLLALSAVFFTINLYLITLLFFFIPIISVVTGAFSFRFKFESIGKEKASMFFKYNFWIALSLIITSIPLDNYIILKISSPFQLGLYAAPFKILTVIYQLSGNFSRVLASRFASFNNSKKTIIFSIKSTLILIILALLIVSTTRFSNYLIPFIFGNNFNEAIRIFNVLTLGFAFFLINTLPNSIILYYFGKSQITFVFSLIKIITFFALLILMVGKSGAIGAAYAFFISELLSLTLNSIYCLLKLKK